MLWRVRATLADRPGALATLAQHCGEREVNILALQIFPGVEGVTDELVLSAPDGWSLSDVAGLVEAAGGTQVSVGVCTEQALVDGPTRYLTAVRQVLHGAERLPTVLARLLDALPVDAGRPRRPADRRPGLAGRRLRLGAGGAPPYDAVHTDRARPGRLVRRGRRRDAGARAARGAGDRHPRPPAGTARWWSGWPPSPTPPG